MLVHEECVECNGVGYIEYIDDRSGEEFDEECDECRGRGEIEVWYPNDDFDFPV